MAYSWHPREDVANMTRENRTCRTRMLRGFSRGCPQQVLLVGLVEFRERHDTRTNGQHYTPQETAGRPIRWARAKLNGEVARHARHDVERVGEDATRMLRGNCSRGILVYPSSPTSPSVRPFHSCVLSQRRRSDQYIEHGRLQIIRTVLRPKP